jgi:hypothetical protein
MDSSIKNVTIILLILTFAFIGYYIFVQNDQLDLATTEGVSDQELFTNVQKYIERRQVLDKVRLDPRIFSDARFLSTVSYSGQIQQQLVGRDNPFDKAESAGQLNMSGQSL